MRLFAQDSRILPALFFALTLCVSPAAYSADPPAKPAPDTILFKNGDLLTGKLVSAEGATVIFHSDIAGDIKVDWSKVKELHTPHEFAVLKKGQKIDKKTPSSDVAQGNISVSSDAIDVQAHDSGKSQSIPTTTAAQVIDQASFNKDLHFKPNFFQEWTGEVTGGVSIVQATQNSQAFNVGISLARALPTVSWLAARNRTTANFTESYGRVTQANTAAAGQTSNAQNTKTSIYHADAERDEYLSPRFYVLADVTFDHNYSQGLDLQQLYGGGFGITIVKQAKQQLDTKIDFHYEKQSFSGSTSPTTNLVGSSVTETYQRKLPRGFTLNESGLLDYSFNNTKAYSSNVSGSLVFPVYKRLAFNVGAVDGYLNNPATGYKSNSFQYTTNISYSLR